MYTVNKEYHTVIIFNKQFIFYHVWLLEYMLSPSNSINAYTYADD